jgi:hypothetical protein
MAEFCAILHTVHTAYTQNTCCHITKMDREFIKDFKYFNVLTSAMQQGYEKELPEDDP